MSRDLSRLTVVPSPAVDHATLRFELDRSLPVRLEAIDASGRQLEILLEDRLGPGAHSLPWVPILR